MTFFSILFALLIEQLRPLRADNHLYGWIRQFAQRIETRFNAGRAEHGQLAWAVVMLALVVPVAVLYWLLHMVSPWLAFVLNVVVVYLTLGFRHYSHYYSAIQLALNTGDEVTARSLLAEWTKKDTTGMDVSEVCRIATEKALVTTHRNVFGVFFWFLMPLGPALAVMYRVAECLSQVWNEGERLESEVFGAFARKAFYVVDYVPARLTAAAFAVVGNFEDAIYAWRNFAGRWDNPTVGVILAAGGGAMGVRLGTPAEAAAQLPADAAMVHAFDEQDEAEGIPGDAPSPRVLQTTVGLVWRALLLWMILLLMVSVADWVS